MSLNADKARLAGLTKELVLRWAETKESWRDARGEEFERKYMQELVSSVGQAVAVIEQLEKLSAKVRSDCE
jgi:hypothetical protein